MRLISQGKEFDGLPNDPVAGTFTVADYGTFAKAKGGYTNMFRVDVTPNNQAITKHAEKVNSNGRYPYSLVPIEVRVGEGKGIPIIVGQALIQEAGEKYKIFIIEGNSNWFDRMSQIKSIRDIDCSEIFKGSGHERDVFYSDLWRSTSGLFYPQVENGFDLDTEVKNYSVYGYGARQPTKKEWRPAVNLDSFIKVLEKHIGWKFTGLDKFTDYKELCIPFTNGIFNRQDWFIEQRRVKFTFENDFWVTPQTLTNDLFQGWNNIPLNSETTQGSFLGEKMRYTFGDDRTYFKNADEDGFYYGEPQTIISQPGVDAYGGVVFEVSFRIKVIDVEPISGASNNVIAEAGETRNGDIGYHPGLVIGSVEGIYEGDCYVRQTYTPANQSTSSKGYLRAPTLTPDNEQYKVLVSAVESYIEIKPAKEIGKADGMGFMGNWNWFFQASDALPDLPPSRIINYLQGRYGLVFIPNYKRKEVQCVSLNEIISSKGKAVDWSEKLDFNNKHVVKFKLDSYGKRNYLRHFNNESNKGLEIISRPSHFDIDNEQLQDEVTVFESSFRLFAHAQSWKGHINLPIINLYPDGKDGDLKDYGPVICRAYQGKSPFVWNNTVIPDSLYELAHLVPNTPGAMYLSLEGLTMDEIQRDYWSQFIKVIQDIKIVECYVRLTVSDILTLDLSKPVYIDYFKSYFLLQEVSQYKFNRSESTKVKLIKI